MTNHDKTLTTKEAAELLGIKPGTLEIWRVYGKSPRWMKIGKAVRYRLSDLNEFMENCTREHTSEGVKNGD